MLDASDPMIAELESHGLSRFEIAAQAQVSRATVLAAGEWRQQGSPERDGGARRAPA
ncbi:hypothetical protein [Mesorhizobium sp. M00.F.Ca.ET.216.01.1.1]|uniref:hypothetical protein n=1 Tax=Mesorhizobium sp. M00.F.Ca.ET.216.01.1.1 TaxID=2500528 RepID=UPI0016778CD1|nr:hypothetical protein [Mesorhizobium sp. M00.F.Ca.ET.216.01.1.1]